MARIRSTFAADSLSIEFTPCVSRPRLYKLWARLAFGDLDSTSYPQPQPQLRQIFNCALASISNSSTRSTV